MKSYDKEFLRAHKEYMNKNFKNALLIYDDLFTKTSCMNANFFKEYAICLKMDLRYEKSKEIADQILLENPKDTELLLNNCICLGKLNNHDEAIKYYEEILKIDATYNIELGYYAYLLERTGKDDMADHYYKVAIELEPENNWYISHYAYFLQKLKRYCEAATYYKRGIDNDFSNSWLLKRYAYFLYETKGKESAYCYYRELIEKNNSNSNYYINAAELAIVYDDQAAAFSFLSKSNLFNKPMDTRILGLFYWGVYYICMMDYEAVDKIADQIYLLRQMHFDFIHRDFSDLNLYIKNNCNRIQKERYHVIFEITIKGRKEDGTN